MSKKIDIKIPDYILKIMTYLEASGFEAFVVGGCVRDSLCGRIPTDWDICTSALPNCIKEIFDGIMTVIPTGEKHGTITVLSKNNAVEVTTFRTDGGYIDGRHPEGVCFVSNIEHDLGRRDFTVNAMAYNHSRGLVDLYGGIDDINLNILRCVGDPITRFEEDALRIMRAIRFSAVCGFEIEKETASAIHLCRELLRKISAERIYEELKKILVSENPSKFLTEYRDVFEVILPQIFSEEIFSVTACALADKMPRNISLRLAAILSMADLKSAKSALAALKTERIVRNTVLLLCEKNELNPPADKVSAKYFLKEFGVDHARLLIEFGKVKTVALDKDGSGFDYANSMIDDVIWSGECFSLKNLDINGSDIINLGLGTGSEIGKLLDTLLNNVIEGNLANKREDLIKFVKTVAFLQ